MAIDFNNTSQYISFSSISAIRNLSQKTISFWCYLDTNAAGRIYDLQPTTFNTDEHWRVETSTTVMYFIFDWTTGVGGQWHITLPSTGTLHIITVTYNNSSTSNDPVIYVDGVSQTVTEDGAPSGSYPSGTNNVLYIGGIPGFNAIDGRVFSLCVYNYIMSASEIADAYASELAIPSYRGLVFAPQLWNVQDGAVLGSTNIIRDLISGAAGTPSGSPTGRADNVLQIEGIN